MTARKSPSAPIDEEYAAVTTAPEDWEWDTVAEAAPTNVTFEKFGEQFIGQYVEKRLIQPKGDPTVTGNEDFYLHIFKGRDGDIYAINDSYSMSEGMENVDAGQWVRITYVKNVAVANYPTPMKSFKIEAKK